MKYILRRCRENRAIEITEKNHVIVHFKQVITVFDQFKVRKIWREERRWYIRREVIDVRIEEEFPAQLPSLSLSSIGS